MNKKKYISISIILFLCTMNLNVPIGLSLNLYSYRFEGRENQTWIPLNSSLHFKLRLWADSPNQFMSEEAQEKYGVSDDNMMDGIFMIAMQSGLCYEDYINERQHLRYDSTGDDRYASANIIETAFQYNIPNFYLDWDEEDKVFAYQKYEDDELAFFHCNTTLLNLPHTSIDRKQPSWTYEQWLKYQYYYWGGPYLRINGEDPISPVTIPSISGDPYVDPEYPNTPPHPDLIDWSDEEYVNLNYTIDESYLYGYLYLFYQASYGIGNYPETSEILEFIDWIDYECKRRAYPYTLNCGINNVLIADGGIANPDWLSPYGYDEKYIDRIDPRNQFFMDNTDINREMIGNLPGEDFGKYIDGDYIYYGGEYGIWENSETIEFTSPILSEGNYSFLIQIAEFDEYGVYQPPKLNLVIWVTVTDQPKPIDAYIYDIIAILIVMYILFEIYTITPNLKRNREMKKIRKSMIPDNLNPKICYVGEMECNKDVYGRDLIAVPGTKPCICSIDSPSNRKTYYSKGNVSE